MKSQLLDKKIELIQWLSTLEDKSIIEKLMSLKKEETKDWWGNASAEEQQSIEQGILDAQEEKLSPHSSARKLYEKWL